MIKIKITLLCFIFLIFSCQKDTGQDEIEGVPKVFELKYDKNKIFDINSKIEIVEVIPLETTDRSIIDRMHKIILKNNKIYVLDKKAGKVFCFDKKGNFISNIGQKGRGPKEVSEIRDMGFNKEGNELFFLDYKKVHIYDPNTFESLKTIELDFSGLDYYNPNYFLPFSRESIIFLLKKPSTYETEGIDFYHLLWLKKGKYEFKLPGSKENIPNISSFVTYNPKQKNYYYIPFGNIADVYTISESDGMHKTLSLNFPNPVSQKSIAESQEIIGASPLYVNQIMEGNHEKYLRRFNQVNEHLLFRFVGNKSYSYEAYLNTGTNEIVIGKKNKTFPVIEYVEDAYFYGSLPAFRINELKNDQTSLESPFIKAMIDKDILDSDNRVLFKFIIN